MNFIEIITIASFIATIIITAILILIVYKDNKKSATNRIFSYLGFVIIIWCTILQFSFFPDVLLPTIWWIRLSVCLATLQTGFILLFSITVPNKHITIPRSKMIVGVLVTTVVMLMMLSPYAFTHIKDYKDNLANPQAGWAFILFNLYAITSLSAAVIILLKKYSKSSGQLKLQYMIVIVGIIITYSLIILTIVIPLVFFDFHLFIRFHFIYLLILLSSFAIAITRYRLFNIRLAIKRWLIKSLVILLISAAGLGIIYGTNSATANPTITYVVTLLVLIVAAVCINYIFDHYLTRSAYDISIPEELELIEDADAALTQLRRDVIKIVRDTYGYETTLFFLYDWREKIYRTYQNDKLVVLPADHSVINMMSAGPTILTTEELKQNKTMPVGVRSEILQFMKRHHADIIIPLYTELFTPGIMVAKRIDPESKGIQYKPQLLDFTRKYGHYMERTLTFDALVRNQRTE